MTAESIPVPDPCADPTHGAGRHWHATFTNRDGHTSRATTRDPFRMVIPDGWTFQRWETG